MTRFVIAVCRITWVVSLAGSSPARTTARPTAGPSVSGGRSGPGAGGLTGISSRSGQPGVALPLQHLGELGGDRLFTLAGLGLWNVEPQLVEVDLIKAGLQDLAVPHGSVQSEEDEEIGRQRIGLYPLIVLGICCILDITR